jgi:hypothetical protein
MEFGFSIGCSNLFLKNMVGASSKICHEQEKTKIETHASLKVTRRKPRRIE